MAREVVDVERLYLGTTEAARKLSCSPEHVRRLFDRGDLAGMRLGRKILIRCNEIDRLSAGDAPRHEAVSSRPERAGKLRALRVALAEAQRLLAEIEE